MELKELNAAEFEKLLKIYQSTAAWLAEKGQAMWNPIYIADRESFVTKYLDPRCYGLYMDGDLAGGFIIKKREDFFWSEDPERSYWYIHKLVVDRLYSGMGLADAMLDWILRASIEAHIDSVRLECYSDRKYLTDLYLRCGFELHEIQEMDDGVKIALFHRDNSEVSEGFE